MPPQYQTMGVIFGEHRLLGCSYMQSAENYTAFRVDQNAPYNSGSKGISEIGSNARSIDDFISDTAKWGLPLYPSESFTIFGQ